MAIIPGVISLLADRLLSRFDAACADPVRTQKRILRSLLLRATSTQLAQELHFREVATPGQFARRVPITPYAQASKLWQKNYLGCRDVTWPGHTCYFAVSSGTTSGEKFLPVTREAIASNLRAGAILSAFLARRGSPENLVFGKFMYLGGSTTLRAKGRCLFGDASGIVGRHLPFYVRGNRLPGEDIACLTDWEQKINGIVSRHLTTDVRVMGACPSWAALLFKQLLRQAHGRGLPGPVGALWPRLSHFVSYGMAFEPYRMAFNQYIGRDIHYVDTYSSSEAGMTAIQEEAGGPMRLIVDNGVFFEFVPADRAHEASPPRLHIGQVELNTDYALIISSNGGIWAYPLGDVVRFVSLRPPCIVFGGRTQLMLSAFGEHVTLEMIENAVAAACMATGAIVADYTIAPIYPSPAQPVPAHCWIMEFDRPPEDPERFMALVDHSIRCCNEDYDTHRTNDWGLQKPFLRQVGHGTFYAWMKQKGKLGGQHKVPRIARMAMAEELMTIAGGRSPVAMVK